LNKNILITGGTGLIGSALSKLLTDNGYQVAILSRRKNLKDLKSFYWNYENNELDPEAIKSADVIIHLAGENLSAKRWSPKQKQKIINSRVKTTQLLFEKTKKSSHKPTKIISASAVGYYGLQLTDLSFSEDDKPGTDFLAQTVEQWEKSVDMFKQLGLVTIKIRTGVVLSNNGGALPKMLMPAKYGLAAPLGTGKQYIPWIALSDLASLFMFLMENQQQDSIFNAVAPNHITNKEFMKAISKSLKKPFFLPPVPSFIFRLIYGEMADVVLKGNKVSASKIQSTGFEFAYKTIPEFMKSI